MQDGIIHVFLCFQLQTWQGLSVDVAKVTIEGKARGPVGAVPHGREGEEVTPALVAAAGVLWKTTPETKLYTLALMTEQWPNPALPCNLLEPCTTMQSVGTLHYHATCWNPALPCDLLEPFTTMQPVGTLHYHATCWNPTLTCNLLEPCTNMQPVGTLHYHATCWNPVLPCNLLEPCSFALC